MSLVAEQDGDIVGNIAFSPVTIGGVDHGWFGLGPVSVRPDRQGVGIGARLVEEGLSAIRAAGARGCVVMGDPGYYGRFGFRRDARLRYLGVPAEYFMGMQFGGDMPYGDVAYHSAFG